MKNIVLSICLFAVLFTACNNSGGNQGGADIPQVEYKEDLPAYPADKIQELITQSNQLDLVFLNKPVSMNVENDGAKQQAYAILPEGVRRPKGCEEMAYLFFKKDGIQLLQVGLVFNDACKYFHIYEEGNLKYANAMRPEGFSFFQNILNQIKAAPAPPQ